MKVKCRGRGMSFFPVKHEKLPPSYIQDAKNFSVVKPLNSGEARASPASPVPRPLYLSILVTYEMVILESLAFCFTFKPKCYSCNYIFTVKSL